LPKVFRRFLIAVAAVAAGAALAVVPATSHSATSSAGPKPRYITIQVTVGRLVARGHATRATGTATASLTGISGARTTVHQKITLRAAAGSNCRVLHLFIQKLDLSLLGLNVHLDKVNLDITGQRHGGVLGRLFCSLANAKVKVKAARAINARLSRHPMRALKTRARLVPQATASQASPTCQVLDLVLGPLNVQLLGLVVDLNQVHLSITATRGGGILGDVFCQLADEHPATTSTATTTSTA
jgi:hypothetical protein